MSKLDSLKDALTGLRSKLDRHGQQGQKSEQGPVEYRFSRCSILMPRGHRLGEYQTAHRLYDRFLPHLAGYLPDRSLVVDVGANVGDTLAAMFSSNPRLKFICIEPDDEFFSLLESNADRVRHADASASIELIQCLVGMSAGNVVLKGAGGTKKAVTADDAAIGMTRRPLDSLVAIGEDESLALIKSDVDGFDFDVIESAQKLIATRHPLLFFECQFDHEFQKNGFERLVSGLPAMGYDLFTIFDNFGEVVLATSQTDNVIQLFDYLWRQNTGRTTRTVFYYDILVSERRRHAFVEPCVADYLRSSERR